MSLCEPVRFSDEERERIVWCCQTLGITFQELVHDATMAGCDEIQGTLWAVERKTLRRLRAVAAAWLRRSPSAKAIAELERAS